MNFTRVRAKYRFQRAASLIRRLEFAVASLYVNHVYPYLTMSFQTRRRSIREARRARSARPVRRQPRLSRKSLGERLCNWREANDLSQSEAAMKLKISKRTLQEWEQGRAEPRHLAMEAINDLISR